MKNRSDLDFVSVEVASRGTGIPLPKVAIGRDPSTPVVGRGLIDQLGLVSRPIRFQNWLDKQSTRKLFMGSTDKSYPEINRNKKRYYRRQ